MAAVSSLNRLYLLLTITILSAVAVMFVVVQPIVAEIRTIQQRTAEKQATLKEKESFLRSIDRKIALLESQVQHEQRLAVMIPDDQQIQDVLRIFHTAALEAGLVVTDIVNTSENAIAENNARKARGESVAVSSAVIPLSADLSFIGTYQQLRAFLTRLEVSPRLLDIARMELSRKPGSEAIHGKITAHYYMHGGMNQ